MNSKPEAFKVDEVEMAERSFLLELILHFSMNRSRNQA
jgi:hypothetical protein